VIRIGFEVERTPSSLALDMGKIQMKKNRRFITKCLHSSSSSGRGRPKGGRRRCWVSRSYCLKRRKKK